MISGNFYGVSVNSPSNTIEGNLIGTNASDTAAVGNTIGVALDGGFANGNTVGGTSAADRNVISGNTTSGIDLDFGTSAVQFNLIEGNAIGSNYAGTAAIPNSFGLTLATASNNTIGGLTATPGTGAGNLISGNSGTGIYFEPGGGGTSNTVEGNLIGPDVTGGAALGTQLDGVYLDDSSDTIGGTTITARNIISGNADEGIDDEAGGNTIEGNFIGTNLAGTAALANFTDIIANGSTDTIGGLTSTPGMAPGNVISGSGKYSIEGTGSNLLVEGNLIGTNATGTAGIANAVGIRLGGTGDIIGGTVTPARNIISDANGVGVQFDGVGVQDNTIEGNYIGTDITGTIAIPNRYGVTILQGASSNTIGGTAPGAGNLISGNTLDGIEIGSTNGTSCVADVVEGNLIGTNYLGTAALPNTEYGVEIVDEATNNTIGGVTALCAQRDFRKHDGGDPYRRIDRDHERCRRELHRYGSLRQSNDSQWHRCADRHHFVRQHHRWHDVRRPQRDFR